jgi:UDP-glucuronate 4-epimerase
MPMRNASQRSHILVTGAAGFIGSTLTDHLLAQGREVTAVDVFDDYYDPAVKRANIAGAQASSRYRLLEHDIEDAGALAPMLDGRIDAIVHLAGRPGVRPSIDEPQRYFRANTLGTVAMLELARSLGIEQFVFASSSSVYGYSGDLPWHEDVVTAKPASPYGASKLGAEAAGRVYATLHGIRFIALRLFTVYGPRQRPDLAIHKFARLMLDGRPIPVFGDGTASRDYTYVDDTVAGITAALDYAGSDFEILNLGNDSPVPLSQLVLTLSRILGVTPCLDRLPEQPGDLPATWADIGKANQRLGYVPRVALAEGIRRFAEWLQESSHPPKTSS